MTPRLSVIVPSHRRIDLLAKCLHSLATHAPPKTQIIVIDDGSADAEVTRAARQLTQCKVIRFDKPHGFCTAVNAGIAQALAPIVQLLNDDAEVTAGWAEAGLAAFADASVVAVAPLVLRWPEGTIDSAGDGYDCGGFAWPRGRGQRLIGDYLIACDVAGASGCAAFYRRDAVIAAGGFPESFRAYFEDVDLACRLRQGGGRIVFQPASRVLHRGSATHGRPRGRLLAQQSCNEERVFWRNTKGTPRELCRHSAVLAGKALRRLSEGNLTPWLTGRCRAWALEASQAWRRSPAN